MSQKSYLKGDIYVFKISGTSGCNCFLCITDLGNIELVRNTLTLIENQLKNCSVSP